MKILVTGCAGFIGFHLCNQLLNDKRNIVYGIDNLNNYYDTKLKKTRLSLLKKKSKNFKFSKKDIGSSISCSGVCLTLVSYKNKICKFFLSLETLNRTNFKYCKDIFYT